MGSVIVQVRSDTEVVLDSDGPGGFAMGRLLYAVMKDERFPNLGRIDPYGITEFNTHEAPAVLQELRQLKGRDEGERRALRQAIEMAGFVARDGSTRCYLAFMGD